MTPSGRPQPSQSGRRPVDVLLVSLGGTIGLQVADDQLAAALRAAGLEVEVARAAPGREVRTLMLTDLIQARAAAAAARKALARVEPRRIIYSTTTAALLWPRPGAIRFDALAQATRPGRHGLWQRPLELRRLRQSPLLLPWDAASFAGTPPDIVARRHVVLPIAIESTTTPGTTPTPPPPTTPIAAVTAAHPVAVTYAADPVKKGLDRILAAWARVRRPGEQLLVTGRTSVPDGYGPLEGVECVGRLEPQAFRALVRAVGVFVIAPRREDYGLVQLEALAEGARVVTTTAPGPYAALPTIRALWPTQVVEGDDAEGLGQAIRQAVDAPPNADDLLRATHAVAPWRAGAVREQVEREVIPALLGPGG